MMKMQVIIGEISKLEISRALFGKRISWEMFTFESVLEELKMRSNVPSRTSIGIFANSSVTRARHVTEDTIEEKRLLSGTRAIFRLEFDERELSSIIVGDEDGRRSKAVDLMSEEVATRDVSIIRHNEASGRLMRRAVFVEKFDQLTSLTTRGSAHIQDFVMRLNIEEQRRDHRDSLLTTNVTNLSLLRKEVFEMLSEGRGAKRLARGSKMIGQTFGVPRQRCRLVDHYFTA